MTRKQLQTTEYFFFTLCLLLLFLQGHLDPAWCWKQLTHAHKLSHTQRCSWRSLSIYTVTLPEANLLLCFPLSFVSICWVGKLASTHPFTEVPRMHIKTNSGVYSGFWLEEKWSSGEFWHFTERSKTKTQNSKALWSYHSPPNHSFPLVCLIFEQGSTNTLPGFLFCFYIMLSMCSPVDLAAHRFCAFRGGLHCIGRKCKVKEKLSVDPKVGGKKPG